LVWKKYQKKIIRQCAIPGKALPDILGHLTEKSKAAITNQFIDNLQFLVVHNHMDIGAIDASRRCNCAAVTRTL